MKVSLAIPTLIILGGALLICSSFNYAASQDNGGVAKYCHSDKVAYIHRHHSTPAEVIERIKYVVTNNGYAERVEWHENEFNCSVAAGVMLRLKGEVTPDYVIIEKCSGALGEKVLKIFKDELDYAYPQD